MDLDISTAQPHFLWDPTRPPVIEIASGQVITATLREVTDDQITATSSTSQLGSLDWSRVYPLLGPIEIAQALPGDAVEIEILSARTKGWGWTANFSGFGLLAEDFPESALHIWELNNARAARYLDVATIPLRPFPGTVGLCPAVREPAPVMPPGHFGGNIDCRDVCVGSRLFLPVQVPGALLSVGDGHGAMGDGEVCGTAIEGPLDVEFRVTLHRGKSIPAPQLVVPPPLRIESAGSYVTMGIGPDLMTAAKDAVRALVDHMVREYHLEPIQAYLLASVAADLKLTEVVDAPNWVVSAYLPLSIF